MRPCVCHFFVVILQRELKKMIKISSMSNFTPPMLYMAAW